MAKTKYTLMIAILLSLAIATGPIIIKLIAQTDNYKSKNLQNNIQFDNEKPEIDVSIDGTGMIIKLREEEEMMR